MPEEPITTLDHIVSSYEKMAAWMSALAAIVFEVAERVLLVGAAKYAAAALPASSPSKIVVTNIAGLLQAVLIFWLITKLWAQTSKDYRNLYAANVLQKPWARNLYRVAALVFVVGFAWWTNSIIHDLIGQTVGAFATPEGH